MNFRPSTFSLILPLLLAACGSGGGNPGTPGGTATAFCTQLTSDPDGDGTGTEAGVACRMRTGFDITADMGYGWNLGNTMDATGNTTDPVGDETQWGNPKTSQLHMDTLKQAGFKTLRLPVSWDDHVTGPDYTINTAWMDRVEEIANYALKDGLYVIVNVHHVGAWENPTTDNEASAADRLTKLWTQIATRFAKYDHHVIFETMNEPRYRSAGTEDWWGQDPSYFTVINHLNAAALAAIRATGGNNAKRLVMMPGYVAGVEDHQLDAIVLPSDKMIALSAHSYSPYNFALNLGSGSVGTFTDTATVDAIFARLDTKFIQKGIPVVMGEWGALLKDNNDERVKHARYFAQKGKATKIPVVWWDNGYFTYDPNNGSGNGEAFGLLDRATNTWRFPAIVDAIRAGWGS
jgi:endoglucanase